MTDPGSFVRWPLLAGSVSLIGTGLALDIADPAATPYASACLALGAVAFGAFVYAEGARQRDWTEQERMSGKRTNDTPALRDPGGDDLP